MKKRYLLIGMLLSGILGWILGFLRLPLVDPNFSFLTGFLSCLAFVLIGLLMAFVWNKNALLLKLIGKATAGAPKIYLLTWTLLTLFIIAGAAASGFLIYQQKEFLKQQTQQQKKILLQQSEMLASNRKSNSIVLMNQLFDKVEEELENNPARTLRDETITRIAALNHSSNRMLTWKEIAFLQKN